MTRFIVPCLVENKKGEIIESKIETLAFDCAHAKVIAEEMTKHKGISENKIEWGEPEKI